MILEKAIAEAGGWRVPLSTITLECRCGAKASISAPQITYEILEWAKEWRELHAGHFRLEEHFGK